MDEPIEELVRRGVFDPAAEGAERHRMVIGFALELGATVDDIEAAGDDLLKLVMRLRLGRGGGRYTLAETAALAGMSEQAAARISLAAGFAAADPLAKTLDDGDIELFQMFHAGSQFFGEEIMYQLTRVMGAATARMAEAFVSAFFTSVGSQQAAEGRVLDPDEIDNANETVIALIPTSVRVIELMLKRHIELRSRMEFPTTEDWQGVDTLDRAVGFCDLVGYTTLSGQVSTTDLSRVLSTFEAVASDLVTQLKGHVVKLIGDEVMFVAPDAATACSIALALVETFDAHPDVPGVRVGLSSGRVIIREGDYFGPTVNLAARMVKLAPEGGALAPASFRDVAGFTYEDAGSPDLKGFDEPVALVLVRR